MTGQHIIKSSWKKFIDDVRIHVMISCLDTCKINKKLYKLALKIDKFSTGETWFWKDFIVQISMNFISGFLFSSSCPSTLLTTITSVFRYVQGSKISKTYIQLSFCVYEVLSSAHRMHMFHHCNIGTTDAQLSFCMYDTVVSIVNAQVFLKTSHWHDR